MINSSATTDKQSTTPVNSVIIKDESQVVARRWYV